MVWLFEYDFWGSIRDNGV